MTVNCVRRLLTYHYADVLMFQADRLKGVVALTLMALEQTHEDEEAVKIAGLRCVDDMFRSILFSDWDRVEFSQVERLVKAVLACAACEDGSTIPCEAQKVGGHVNAGFLGSSNV